MSSRTAPQQQELARRLFRLIAFDWDGTAVTSRSAPATDVVARVEALDRAGVICAVITGTSIGNLESTFFARVDPRRRAHLLACMNRGSEVFGYDASGARLTLYRREATPAEDSAMDEIALTIRDELADEYGLETEIVFDRLNRRKIDLIPVPEWADPPKARIGELLAAVDARLHRCQVPGGILHVMDRVHAEASRRGIDLRLTTDVKHVELGLTDKSDSVAYLLKHVAAPRGIERHQMCFVGDEFGPIAGFPGSDYLMHGVAGAAYYSVGPEPNGVPEGVVRLGGGIPRFLEILDAQIRQHEEAEDA